MNINFAAITDVGIERTNNEDAVIICSNIENQNWGVTSENTFLPLGKYGSLMIVADGMGGVNAGEIASAIAIDSLRKYFSIDNLCCNITDKIAYNKLTEAIQLANKAIMEYVVTDSNATGLGTTIVVTWIIENKAFIAWCGDSRCYCYNQNTGLKQLTKDHSYVQKLIDEGKITKKEAFNHPDNNIITKCLGDVDSETEPDIITYNINEGDILLVCSDGLCGYCDDKTIEKTLLYNFDNLQQCKDNLLQLALKAGGQDNITIALCATLPDTQQQPIVSTYTKIKRFIRRL